MQYYYKLVQSLHGTMVHMYSSTLVALCTKGLVLGTLMLTCLVLSSARGYDVHEQGKVSPVAK